MTVWLSRLTGGCRALFARRAVERELDDELRAHFEMAVEQKMAARMSRAEARRAARLEMGNLEVVKDQVRDVGWESLVDAVGRDLRDAWRSVRRSPGVTTLAVLTLALGLGSATAVFTLAHGVLFTPLPYEDPDRLVQFELGIGPDRFGISPGQYVTIEHQSRRLSGVGAFYVQEMTLTSEERPERIRVGRMTASFLPVLGVTPSLGRYVAPEARRTGANGGGYLLGHRTWVRRFGADPGVLGRPLTLDGVVAPIVGVLPEGFFAPRDLLSPGDVEVWAPLVLNRADLNWGNHYLTAIGRLAPGADLARAQTESDLLLDRIGRARPAYFPDNVEVSLTVSPVLDRLTGEVRPALLMLIGAVSLVVLITTANVGGMLLSRGHGRRRELAVRAALGAGRWSVSRQLLTESVLLAGGATVLGTAVAALLLAILPRLAPADLPRLDGIGLDWWALSFIGVIGALTALVLGVVSAASALRSDLSPSLETGLQRGDIRRESLGREVLVTGQIALAVVLIVAAGLLLRSFGTMLQIDPGFDPSHLLTLRVAPPEGFAAGESSGTFRKRLVERFEELPGVTGVAAANAVPLADHPGDTVFDIEGRPSALESGARDSAQYQHATQRMVTPGYFDVLGVPILGGRGFRESDRAGAPGVVIINQQLAERFWHGRDPVGRRMRMHWTPHRNGRWLEIVGVAGNAKQLSLIDEFDTEMLHPVAQAGPNTGIGSMATIMVLIRTTADPTALVETVRHAAASLDPRVPVYDIRTMDQRVAASIAQPRLTLVLVGAFSLVSLGLAAIAIYGVVAHAVNQRTTELAIRIALGARTGSLLALVLGRAWRSGVVGLTAGLAAAVACARVFRAQFYGIDPTDPVAIGAVVVTVSAALLVAIYLPARRVSAVDPITALRVS
ncbi:MAG: ABC transporter permease [Acidobacteria bacterium]|nr:ABC transporter permease [Acidobacteriota bacterium]